MMCARCVSAVRTEMAEVERVRPKTIHMLGEIRAETGNRRVGEVKPLREQLLEHVGLRLHVVKDETVGHHVAVLDNLALGVAIVFGNDARPTEREPLDKVVERFTFVGSGLNEGP